MIHIKECVCVWVVRHRDKCHIGLSDLLPLSDYTTLKSEDSNLDLRLFSKLVTPIQ